MFEINQGFLIKSLYESVLELRSLGEKLLRTFQK